MSKSFRKSSDFFIIICKLLIGCLAGTFTFFLFEDNSRKEAAFLKLLPFFGIFRIAFVLAMSANFANFANIVDPVGPGRSRPPAETTLRSLSMK